jgi:hypothetical protein
VKSLALAKTDSSNAAAYQILALPAECRYGIRTYISLIVRKMKKNSLLPKEETDIFTVMLKTNMIIMLICSILVAISFLLGYFYYF